MAQSSRHMLWLLWLASVVSVALCFLPSLVLAQGTQPGEARAAASSDDVQKNLEEIRKTNAKLSTVIATATAQLTDLAQCTNPRQCGAKIGEPFPNMRMEVFNVLDKLGFNSELMDAVLKAKESILVLRAWYARQPSGYPQRDATIKDLETQITNLDQAVERIQDGRVIVQDQLQALMLQQRDQMILKGVRAAVEAVHSVAGELGNLSKALDDEPQTLANTLTHLEGMLASLDQLYTHTSASLAELQAQRDRIAQLMAQVREKLGGGNLAR